MLIPVPITVVFTPPPAPIVIAKTCPAVTDAIKIAVAPEPPPSVPDPEPPLPPVPPAPVAVIFNFVVPVGTVKLNVPVPVFASGVPVVFVTVVGYVAAEILVKPPPRIPPVAVKLPATTTFCVELTVMAVVPVPVPVLISNAPVVSAVEVKPPLVALPAVIVLAIVVP
jgi:homeobox protein ESX1